MKTTTETAELLARECLFALNHTKDQTGQSILLKHIPLVELLDVVSSAIVLYEETADYIRVNHLGDVHHNKSMRDMRDTLAALRAKLL